MSKKNDGLKVKDMDRNAFNKQEPLSRGRVALAENKKIGY